MPFLYNYGPQSYYLNNSPYLENLQVYLRPNSYTGSGNIWENVQNSTEATIFNNPTYNYNTGFTLNGTSQYISLPSTLGVTNFTTSNNYTIEFWTYINSTQQDTGNIDNCIVEKWNSTNESSYPYVARLMRTTNAIKFAVYNGSENPGSSTSAVYNNWAQYLGVFDHQQNIISIYKNGQLSNTGAMSIAGTINNNSTVNIGRRALFGDIAGSNYFTGIIGIIRIYSSALTSSQVLQNYNSDKSQFGLS